MLTAWMLLLASDVPVCAKGLMKLVKRGWLWTAEVNI